MSTFKYMTIHTWNLTPWYMKYIIHENSIHGECLLQTSTVRPLETLPLMNPPVTNDTRVAEQIDDDDVPPLIIQYLCRHFLFHLLVLFPYNTEQQTTDTSPLTKLHSCRALLCLSRCALHGATCAGCSAKRSVLPLPLPSLVRTCYAIITVI